MVEHGVPLCLTITWVYSVAMLLQSIVYETISAIFSRYLFMVEHVMPLCLTITWVYSVAMLVQSIVFETISAIFSRFLFMVEHIDAPMSDYLLGIFCSHAGSKYCL